MHWFAVQVRLRYAQLTAAALRNKGYDVYLPLYRRELSAWGRSRQVEVPLFPGYLFCALDPARRLPILTTPGVVGIVGAGKTPVPVEESELNAVRAVLRSGLLCSPWPFLKNGQRVVIRSGPLRGVEGIFLAHTNRHRLVVSVFLLQRSVAVEIDANWVAPVEEPPGATQRLPAGPCATTALHS